MATLSTNISQSEPLPFYKTIRFKLTFLYSSIVYLFSGLLVFSFNILINDYLKRDPQHNNAGIIRIIPFDPDNYGYDFTKLKLDEQAHIREARLNDLRQIQRLSIISLIPLAIGSFFLGYYLSGKFLNPISKLRNSIEELETKDLGLQLSNNAEDEVGALVRSFNNLSTRLQESFQSQEQFVQNASHEIRTPLTIIQTNIDTVLDDPKATNDDLRNAMKNSLTGVKQLRKLVNYLLELTISHHEDFKPVKLNNIIETQLTLLSDLAKEKGIKLHAVLKVTKDQLVNADEALLGRAFYNIVENALKYSLQRDGEYEPITIETKQIGRKVEITVTNHSEVIPKEKLTKIFDRFYQVDPSRSKKLGGYGLGLAIVKKIIGEHGGVVTAISTTEKTVFTVILPSYKPKEVEKPSV